MQAALLPPAGQDLFEKRSRHPQKLLIIKNFREVQGGRRPHPKKALKGHLVTRLIAAHNSLLIALNLSLLRAKSQELRAKPKGFLVAEGNVDGKFRYPVSFDSGR